MHTAAQNHYFNGHCTRTFDNDKHRINSLFQHLTRASQIYSCSFLTLYNNKNMSGYMC